MGAGATPSCSFCGKSVNEVSTLIAGHDAHICEECVVTCVGVLKDKGIWPSAPVWLWRAIRHKLRIE